MTANDKGFEALLTLSERMAVAAETGAWDELEAASEQYFVQFSKLSSSLASPPTVTTLQALVRNQQRVLDSAQPWMTATKSLLDAWAESRRFGSLPPPTPE